MSRRSFILLIISSFQLCASDTFISKDEELRYVVNGTYISDYCLKKECTEEQKVQQLNRFKTEIANTAHGLQNRLGLILAKNAHLVVIFPKEGPTIRLKLKIMMNNIPGSGERSADQLYEYSGYTSKNNRSKDEEIEYTQFRNGLKTTALRGCDSLLTILDDYQNVIGFKENSCAIGLDVDLYMSRLS